MDISGKRTAFDWFCDFVLFVFLCVVMGYGPDNHKMFIPAEILFVATFGVRFFVKRSSVTNVFVGWSILFFLLALISGLYAYDKPFWFIRIKATLQVLVFANLVFPYFRESEQSFTRFLYMYLMSIVFVTGLLLVKTPFNTLLTIRLGELIGVNPNFIGYIYSVAILVSIYLGYRKKLFLALVPLFLVLSALSGSRKVFILIIVGTISIILLQQHSIKKVVLAVVVCLLLGGFGLAALILIEPLRRIIGQRLLDMIVTLGGSSADVSTSIRLDMIAQGMQMFKQKPLFGWGLGAFDVYAGFDSYTHNNYVELLVAVGIVGTLVYYSLCVSIVVMGLKKFFTFGEKGPFVLVTALMLAMLFDQVARVTFIEEYSNILIALCFAGVVVDRPDTGKSFFEVVSLVFGRKKSPLSYSGETRIESDTKVKEIQSE